MNDDATSDDFILMVFYYWPSVSSTLGMEAPVFDATTECSSFKCSPEGEDLLLKVHAGGGMWGGPKLFGLKDASKGSRTSCTTVHVFPTLMANYATNGACGMGFISSCFGYVSTVKTPVQQKRSKWILLQNEYFLDDLFWVHHSNLCNLY